MHITYWISCMYPVPLAVTQEGVVEGLEQTPFWKIARDSKLFWSAQAGWFLHIAITLLCKKVLKNIGQVLARILQNTALLEVFSLMKL